MEEKDIGESLEKIFEEAPFKPKAPPLTRFIANHYDKIIRFQDEKGWRLRDIYDLLIEKGFLNQDTNLGSFKTALWREKSRREHNRKRERTKKAHTVTKSLNESVPEIVRTEVEKPRQLPLPSNPSGKTVVARANVDLTKRATETGFPALHGDGISPEQLEENRRAAREKIQKQAMPKKETNA